MSGKSAQELAAENPDWEICEVAPGGQVSDGFSDKGPGGISTLFFDAVVVEPNGARTRVGRSDPFEIRAYGVGLPSITETHDPAEVRGALLAQLQQEGWNPLPDPDGHVQDRDRLWRPKSKQATTPAGAG